jgi:hypothetical protein
MDAFSKSLGTQVGGAPIYCSTPFIQKFSSVPSGLGPHRGHYTCTIDPIALERFVTMIHYDVISQMGVINFLRCVLLLVLARVLSSGELLILGLFNGAFQIHCSRNVEW